MLVTNFWLEKGELLIELSGFGLSSEATREYEEKKDPQFAGKFFSPNLRVVTKIWR